MTITEVDELPTRDRSRDLLLTSETRVWGSSGLILHLHSLEWKTRHSRTEVPSNLSSNQTDHWLSKATHRAVDTGDVIVV